MGKQFLLFVIIQKKIVLLQIYYFFLPAALRLEYILIKRTYQDSCGGISSQGKKTTYINNEKFRRKKFRRKNFRGKNFGDFFSISVEKISDKYFEQKNLFGPIFHKQYVVNTMLK